MNKLHLELFSEEYDYIYDSVADARDRSKGINPMSQAYIDKTNERRINMGVKPYDITDDSPQNHKLAINDSSLITSELYIERLNRQSTYKNNQK